MSATEELRVRLERLGIRYGQLGDYYTMVHRDGLTWTMRDQFDGHLTVGVSQPLEPAQAVDLLPRVTAMASTCDEDGVGHSECLACGRTVGPQFNYCPWCGSRFEERRTEAPHG